MVSIFASAIKYGAIFWLAMLCRDFAWLRSARIQDETSNNIKELEELQQMTKRIERKVEERANQIKAGAQFNRNC
jgi:hypothetical protein